MAAACWPTPPPDPRPTSRRLCWTRGSRAPIPAAAANPGAAARHGPLPNETRAPAGPASAGRGCGRPARKSTRDARLRRARKLAHHHDRRADAHAAIKIGDVLVVHADTAVGHEAADRVRRVGAVDGVFAARQGHRRDAHRIARAAARDYVRQPGLVEVVLTRRRPPRLDGFAVEAGLPGPLLAAAA